MIKITEKEFSKLAGYIKENYGIHLKKEKQILVMGRLQNVLAQMNFSDFSSYYDHIINDKTGDSVNILVDKITTNHTFFMREAEHFKFFKEEVLSYMSEAIKEKDLRTWCAACSTGEESYTLAMLIKDHFKNSNVLWDTKILATDISNKVLDTARKGIYKSEKISSLPLYWRNNYFRKADEDSVVVTDNIKNEVLYRKFNLMENIYPFKKKFHVIFCRNVMIYFDNATKEKLIRKFYEIMEYGGYLFIGLSESLNRDTTGFKYVRPSVYRKI